MDHRAEDADRYLVYLRKDRGQAKTTVQGKAGALAQFFDFLIVRYQGDIHALTGCVLSQPIDGYNRPAKAGYGHPRVPPSEDDVQHLFGRLQNQRHTVGARVSEQPAKWLRAKLSLANQRVTVAIRA